MRSHLLCLRVYCAVFSILVLSVSVSVADEQAEAEYRKVIEGRAAKIVETLGIEEHAQVAYVTQLIADQYANLRAIHDPRDAELDRLKADNSLDEAVKQLQREQIEQNAELQVFRLHRSFVSKLAAELPPEQVSQVKDGMTYGVLGHTLGGYKRLLPEMTDEQLKAIEAMLLEAREYAMDGGSSDEKHGWFRKYKGRINNYLSSQGYDIKAAEARLKKQ